MNRNLVLPTQYNRLWDPAKPYGCPESTFNLVSKTLNLPLAETALVLVDAWNVSCCKTYEERSCQIIRDRLKPVLHAGRAVGMTIIHTPAPQIAYKYDHLNPYIQPGDEPFVTVFGERDPEWPPADLVDRKGRYAGFHRRYAIPAEYYSKQYEAMDIDQEVAPEAPDIVINTASQMQRCLKERKILHLIYTGFATNMCLLQRDYGVRAMAWLGYNPIILRDCTTGVEFTETADNLMQTHVNLRMMEHSNGFSALSGDFLKACQALND
jgi:nicotinamidase-related amidase